MGERRGNRRTLSRGGNEAREALLHPTPPYPPPPPGDLSGLMRTTLIAFPHDGTSGLTSWFPSSEPR